MKKNIAVIEGGFSNEAEISYKSSETVRENLDANKYKIWQVRIDNNGWNLIQNGELSPINKDDFSAMVNGEKINFDAAFIIIHGTPGEDGKLQGYFDMLNIPYTTCDQFTSALTFNKFYCNRVLISLGFNCAKSVFIAKKDTINTKDILAQVGLPCFVKPADGGSSFGASKVDKEEQLESAIQLALQHGSSAIIEEYLKGTEVTNGVFSLGGKTTVLPITEVVTTNEFFDYKAKYKGESQEITPARLDEEMTKKIQELTLRAYEALKLKGVCRIDYIIKDGVPYLVEINTVPGQSKQSIIPQQAACVGISLPQLYNAMVEECFN
jgi:D-alanine-D-alanine ligase